MTNKFEIANFNLFEFSKRFWDMFGDPTPKNVEIPQKDANGNIVNYLSPNRALFKQQIWDDVGGALGQFGKKYYIDPINGSDTNDGTSTYPFQSIAKAIDVMPIGAVSNIYIKEGTDNELSSSSSRGITGKYIIFLTWGDSANKPTIRLTNFKHDNGNIYYKYYSLTNASINFYNDFNFVIDDVVDSSAPVDSWRCFFRIVRGVCDVSGKSSSITLKDTVRFLRADDYTGISFSMSWNAPAITTNSNTYFVSLDYSATARFKIRDTSNVDDTTYLLAGILKDSNGAYKNILTNLDL